MKSPVSLTSTPNIMQKVQGGLGRGLGSLLPSMTVPLVVSVQSDISPVELKTPTTNRIVEQSYDRILQINPSRITANPRQPRLFFQPDDLSDLMASVKEHGIISPLVVTDKGDGTYELIAGERRLRAALAVGLTVVPVIVRQANDQQKLELALIENIQRSDLNAVEEAKAYQQLIDDFELSQEEVAGRVGKGRSVIANTLRLLALPADMLGAVIDGRISKSHARTLLAEPNEEKRRLLFNQMVNNGMTVRHAESETRRSPKFKDPNIAAIEVTLREKLGTKVTIDVRGSESTIAIHCYSREDLVEMVKRLNEI